MRSHLILCRRFTTVEFIGSLTDQTTFLIAELVNTFAGCSNLLQHLGSVTLAFS